MSRATRPLAGVLAALLPLACGPSALEGEPLAPHEGGQVRIALRWLWRILVRVRREAGDRARVDMGASSGVRPDRERAR